MPDSTAGVWEPKLADLWYPPEDLTVSGWAEKYRLIVSKDAAEPGPWHNARVPYLTEIMDVLGDEVHEEVVFVKAARIGGTEAARNALGYWVSQDPGPILWVYPTEEAAREQVRKEIVPLLTEVPVLAKCLTGRSRDIKTGEIALTTCNVYAAWSGSPQTLGARTIRRVVCDEVDKFRAFSGRDADPVSLGRRRIQTYEGRGKLVLVSTPTTSDGAIWQSYLRCTDQRKYFVPCPHCDELQVLDFENCHWAGKGDKVDLLKQADLIEASQDCWFQCVHCSEKILESHRAQAVRLGQWVSEGFPPGEHPVSRRVGFQMSALYSTLGVSLPRIVGDFLRAKAGGYGQMMEFVTQVLGMPFDGAVHQVGSKHLARMADQDKGRQRGLVPAWATLLVCGVDTQKRGFYWTVRAFSQTESQLVDFGVAENTADLEIMLTKPWLIEDTSEPGRLSLMLIDCGGSVNLEDGSDETTRDIVYRFSLYDPRVVACMGRDTLEPPYVRLKTAHNFGGCTGRLLHHRPDHFKDVMADLWCKPMTERTWRMCHGVDAEYLEHLSNSRKVETKDGKLRWGRKYHGAKIDYHDAEALCLVGLRLAQLGNAAKG